MKSFQIFIIFLIIVCPNSLFGQRDFYVNSFSNSDTSNGSKEFPFKSLSDLKMINFKSGDRINLLGNQILEGSIHLKDILATKDNPVTINTYGEGVAQIYSGNESAVIIEACENIRIVNIAVKGSGRKKGNKGSGIEINNSRFIELDIVEASGYLINGIGVTGGGDISITNSYVHSNGYNGIEVTGEWGLKGVRNIYIGYCIAENNAGSPMILENHSGSGILIGHSTNTTVEYCEAMNNGWDMPRSGNGPVGIWGYECDSLTIQYCYSHDNKTSPDGLDGGGFDFDGGITNSIMQYNLSMNNEGAGYGLFQFGGASKWSNNIIRNNISINDGIKNSQAGIYLWCDPYNKDIPLSNTIVYDNLIISNQGHSIAYNTGFSSGFVFANNSFLLTNEGTIHLIGDDTKKMAIYKDNTFWSELAEKKGNRQPKVKYDKTASYKKIDYTIPKDIEIKKIKEIVKHMLNDRYGSN